MTVTHARRDVPIDVPSGTAVESGAEAKEAERLAALRGYGLLGVPSDAAFDAACDDFTLIASHICDASIALITLLDADWQWHKSRIGIDSSGVARSVAFCHHAIKDAKTARTGGPFVVPDAWDDERFANNPLVTSDPHVRFYAGAPLVTPGGHTLGTLCVLDRVPRRLRPAEATALSALSRQLMQMMELRRVARDQERLLSERRLTQAALVHARNVLEQRAMKGDQDLTELQSHYQAALDTLASLL